MSDDIKMFMDKLDKIGKSKMVFDAGTYIGPGVGKKENLRQKPTLSKNNKDAIAQEKLDMLKETGFISENDEDKIDDISDRAIDDFMKKLVSDL